MSAFAAYLDDSASVIRRFTPAGDESWTPPADAGPEGDAFAHRKRLSAAAAWLAGSLDSRKRLDAVCLGVSDAVCRSLTAPSAEPDVVIAAARGKGEEWGAHSAVGATEPLAAPPSARRRRSAHPETGDSHFPVLTIHDASVRVLLDELDKRAVRVGAVLTLWHALCRAWDESLPTDRAREDLPAQSDNGNTEPTTESPITAILTQIDEHTVVWAWSRGRRLVTGGRAALAHTHPPDDQPFSDTHELDYRSACGRISLDWLTWSAQLGRTPDRILIIGPEADARRLAAECDRLWPDAPHREIVEGDPVAATLNQLVAADPIRPESDGRTCVATLTNRPGRAHRRLHQWIGVSLLVVAVAIGGLGWRFNTQAERYQRESANIEARVSSQLTPIDPRLARDPRPARALEGRIAELATQSEGFEEPDPPLPILQEFLRVGNAIGDAPDVRIERFEVGENRSVLRLRIPDTATGEQIVEALRTSDGAIRWVEAGAGGLQTGRVILNGTWTIEGPRL